jgi:hypothetical protein
MRGQHDNLRRKSFLASVAVWAVAGLGLGAAPWSAAMASRELPWPAMIFFSAASAVFVGIVCLRFAQAKLRRAAIVMGVGTSILIFILYGALLPNFRFLQISERIVQDMPPEARGPNVPVAMIGYIEPSLAFYQGGGTRECADDYLQTTPSTQWPQWITIDSAAWRVLPPELRQQVNIRAGEKGIAYATTGQPETILLLQKK